MELVALLKGGYYMVKREFCPKSFVHSLSLYVYCLFTEALQCAGITFMLTVTKQWRFQCVSYLAQTVK